MDPREVAQEEWIEERSAILEYDAGYPREIAERLAREEYARWREHILEGER